MAGTTMANDNQVNAPVPISPDWRKEEIREDIPCGTSVTTRYMDASGTVMRQDVEIIITKQPIPVATAGRIG